MLNNVVLVGRIARGIKLEELKKIFSKVDKFVYQDDINYFEIPRELSDEKEQ